MSECPIETGTGTVVADVAWATPKKVKRNFDPSWTESPEIVVEVLSPSNAGAEIRKKRSWTQPIAVRIAANMLLPDSDVTGCLAFSSACSTSSGGSSLRNGDGWQGRTWPYFFRPAQWLIESVCIARVTAT